MDAESRSSRAGARADSSTSTDASASRLGRRVDFGFALCLIQRALEAVCVGSLAAALVTASVLVTTPFAASSEIAVAASIGGACAALAWWLEHPPARRAYVRALDDATSARGALTTAVDALVIGRPSPLSEALAARVAASVDRAACVRAARPRRPWIFAAPLVAVAILLLAFDQRAARAPASTGSPTGALDAAARDLRTASRAAAAPTSAALSRAAERIDDTLRALAAPSADATARSAAASALTHDLETELARAEHAAGAPRALAQALTVAREVSAALSKRGGGTRAPGFPASATPESPGSASGGALSPSSGAAVSAPGSASAVTPAASDGRMVAPQGAESTPGVVSGPAFERARGVEAGVGSSRWWSPAYDGVVERFVEARRAARKP